MANKTILIQIHIFIQNILYANQSLSPAMTQPSFNVSIKIL